MATGSSGNRYGKNQFYNINALDPTIKGLGIESQDNPDFLWPKDFYRTPSTGKAVNVQRGYMRLIADAYGSKDNLKNLAKRRLHFQFNPDTLTRQVNARNDVQMWMNQDPAQFTQPVPGDANFSFELLFNREAEMATGRYKSGTGLSNRRNDPAIVGGQVTSSREQDANRRNITTTSVTPYDPASVTDIGVLADLIVFDQIIGQGMNSQLINTLLNRTQSYIDAYNRKQLEKTGDDEDKEVNTVEFNQDNVSSVLNANIGNSAFLVSQPVRVVFSSLFMVEGFITGTSVLFNKFNPAMVPTQCSINVQMQAMYIGFAAEKTFLTQTFELANKQQAEADKSQAEENKGLTTLGKTMFSKFESANVSNANQRSFGGRRLIESQDKDGVTKVALRFKTSSQLKDFAKNRGGTITANAVWQVFYTRPSGSIPGDVGYSQNEEVTTTVSSKSFNMSDLASGADTLTWEFSRPVYDVNKKWDTTSGAKYKSKFYVYSTIDGNSGGTIIADEWAYAEADVGWTTLPVLVSYIQRKFGGPPSNITSEV
jgi:hypothetical protein